VITFKGTKSLKDYDSVSLASMLRQHVQTYYPIANVENIDNAIQVASYLHRNDVRRGGRSKLPNPPYIEHPLRVALRMATYFDVRNADVLVASILHDTVEDHAFEFADFQGVHLAQDEATTREHALSFISKTFGYQVASIVERVSNPIIPSDLPKSEKVKMYQSHVEKTTELYDDALILKFSDFVDNAGSLHHHYDYDDKKVSYFLDRYEALIPMYRERFKAREHTLFDVDSVLIRLDEVEKQFKRFRAALS